MESNFFTVEENPIDRLNGSKPPNVSFQQATPTPPTVPKQATLTPPPTPPQVPKQTESTINIEQKIKTFLAGYGKPVNLVILTPCYGGLAHVNYMICLINTLNFLKQFNINTTVEFCKNDSLITRARNNLIAKALTNQETTHVLFIDADIGWNPVEVVKLLIADKDIVGGVYPLKNYNWGKLLSTPNNTSLNSIIDLKKKDNNYFSHFDNETILKSQLLKFNMNPAEQNLYIVDNIAEVRHIPTGFMLMKREMIEKMIDAHSTTKYCDDIGFLSKTEEKYAYSLFDCGIVEGHYLSEDWMFCERWRKIGGRIFMDITIMLSHTGNEDYTGSFFLST